MIPPLLRISKLTDYGTVLLAYLAARQSIVCSAAEAAAATGISLPTTSKLLKALSRSGIITSTRGSNGGYRLYKNPSKISATDIIDAIEGSISITECCTSGSQCEYEGACNVSDAWQRVNIAIRSALDDVSLSDLLRTNNSTSHFRFADLPITVRSEKR